MSYILTYQLAECKFCKAKGISTTFHNKELMRKHIWTEHQHELYEVIDGK